MWQLNTSWQAQIRILWIGQVIILAMLTMSMPYWPLYIAELGQFTPQQIRFWSAAIYIAPFVTSIISGPLWGRLGDKHGYKPMVIRACLGLFITQVLIMLVTNVAWIFAFRLLQGVLAGFVVAAQAWALSISPTTQKGATLGKLQAATAISALIGPLLGGMIATIAGYHAIFSWSSFICVLITLMFFCCLQNTAAGKNETVTTTKKSALSLKKQLLMLLQQHLLAILMVMILIQLARQAIMPVFALFVTEQLAGNAMSVGMLYAAPGVMIFITAAYWGKYFDKLLSAGQQVYGSIIGLLFLSALLQALHAYADSIYAMLILRLLWGVCLGALAPVLLRLLVDTTSKQDQGLFLGLGNSATKLGNLLGILLGALIESYFGYFSTFMFIASLYIVAGFIVYAKRSVLSPTATLSQNALN